MYVWGIYAERRGKSAGLMALWEQHREKLVSVSGQSFREWKFAGRFVDK